MPSPSDLPLAELNPMEYQRLGRAGPDVATTFGNVRAADGLFPGTKGAAAGERYPAAAMGSVNR
jgi:hypothetical protein